MGDRAQVFIKDTGVYLYTHWSACELPSDVQKAIEKRWRWDDPEYLARIIFDEMTRDTKFEETGYGISTAQHGDVWRIITIDCGNQSVKVTDDGRDVFAGSFEAIASQKVLEKWKVARPQ